jgi:two-component system, NtrC family, response regulator AtoC
MSTLIGSALSETADKLHFINQLVTENKFVEAKTELDKLSPFVEQHPGSLETGEFYYLLAVAEFSSKPHLEVLDLARKAYEIVSTTAANLVIGRIQELMGKLCVAIGDLTAGEDYIRDAISSFRRINCESELVGCYNKLAQVYFVRGEYKLADKFLTQSMELLAKDASSPEYHLYRALGNQARIKTLLGEWDSAQKMLEDCVEYCRRSENQPSEAKNLLSLGYVHYLKEEYTEARTFYEQAHGLIKALDAVRDRSIFHEYMGDLLRAMGDHKMARQHYGYAMEIGNRIGPQSAIISQTRRRLAMLEHDCGNYALAAEHAARALEVSEMLGEIVEVAAAKAILGSLAAIKGNYNDAVTSFDQAITCLDTAGEISEHAEACYLAGKSLVKSKDHHGLASRYLNCAIRLAERLGLKHLLVRSYYQLSTLHVEMSNYDEALTILEECETLAMTSSDDRAREECRILRLTIEDQMVDAGLSHDNQFFIFSSFLTASEYGNLKSGSLSETLEILRKKIGGDRAFVLSLDAQQRIYEPLAYLAFDPAVLGKISRTLSNGKAGTLPLDRPLLVTSLLGERDRIFDYLNVQSGTVRSFVAIPIQLSQEAIGILYVDRLGENTKPFSKANLDFAIAFSDIIAFKSSEEQKKRLTLDNQRLKDQLERQHAFPNFVTTNPVMLDILSRVAQVKDSPISILIEGDTGTGKDFLAKAIHFNSNRKGKRFISVNCAALPETLLESELFGYKRGAFTGADGEKVGLFEEADGGTFFLDEIGDMPLSIQVKLLRVIEEKEVVRLGDTVPRKVDVRVISATNRDLKMNMEQGQFRQDLYYRLSTFAFKLPGLRERREDIPLLIKHFIDKCDPQVKIEPEAFNYLADYDWPGNVRELENEIKKMVLLSGERKVITGYLISRRISESSDNGNGVRSATTKRGKFSLYEHISRLERDYILGALRKSNWVKKYAAESLAIPESTLRLKIKQYHITQE